MENLDVGDRVLHFICIWSFKCSHLKQILSFPRHFAIYKTILAGWPLVREKSGKFDFSSRSGKSQGILQIGQGNFKYQETQGKVKEFHNFGPKYML